MEKVKRVEKYTDEQPKRSKRICESLGPISVSLVVDMADMAALWCSSYCGADSDESSASASLRSPDWPCSLHRPLPMGDMAKCPTSCRAVASRTHGSLNVADDYTPHRLKRCAHTAYWDWPAHGSQLARS